MSHIIGKWKVNSGQFMGLTYEFNSDDSFIMEMSMYGVKGSGNYSINNNADPKEIVIDFTEHTSGAAGIGIYKGIYDLENNVLRMKVGTANGERWLDETGYICYSKV